MDFLGRVLYASRLMPDWTAHAACRGRDISVFFPEDDRSPDDPVVLRARVICAACPVRAPCLAWALANKHSAKHGVYAGTTGEERELAMRTGALTALFTEEEEEAMA